LIHTPYDLDGLVVLASGLVTCSKDGRHCAELILPEEDAKDLFTIRRDAYRRFIRLVRYRQGLYSFFNHCKLLRPGLRILDAGCGLGDVTLALRDALVRRGLRAEVLHAFDLTPAMLDGFNDTLSRFRIHDVELHEANILQLDGLPESWTGYDLIVTASMLEYIRRDQLAEAIMALRQRLQPSGHLLAFVTKRNWLMRPLIGRWWRSVLYDGPELASAFRHAGFSDVSFETFPAAAWHLALWGYIVHGQAFIPVKH
jgi:SAM-dependent methyltransferase